MTDAQKAEEASRAAFEARFPIPLNCERCGPGYTATSYSAWPAHDHSQRWTGWQAGATWAASQSAAEVAALRAEVERLREAASRSYRYLRFMPWRPAKEELLEILGAIHDETAALAATQPKEPTP